MNEKCESSEEGKERRAKAERETETARWMNDERVTLSCGEDGSHLSAPSSSSSFHPDVRSLPSQVIEEINETRISRFGRSRVSSDSNGIISRDSMRTSPCLGFTHAVGYVELSLNSLQA